MNAQTSLIGDADLHAYGVDALSAFPDATEGYRMADDEADALGLYGAA